MALWTDFDLDPQHQRKVQDSGLDPEVAAERGYRTVRTPEDVPGVFSKPQRQLVPALLIPVYGVDETAEPVAYELRPDNPRTDGRTARKGKPAKVRKYEFPAGHPKRLDVPRRVRDMLGKPDVPLWITEGALKADAAASVGMCAVSLAGVWAFRSTNVDGGKVELPDFDRVALNGRDVYPTFDSDVVVKPEVKRALRRLAGIMDRRGAKVHVVVLPPGPKGEKRGLDDMIAAGATEDDLLKLVDDEFLEGDDDRSLDERLYDFIRDNYELGQDTAGNGFAIPSTGPRVVRMLYTGRPSLELEAPAEFHRSGDQIVSRRVVKDVLSRVEAECLTAPRQELHLRTAPAGNGLVVDLGDDSGRVVAVSPAGWKVVNKAPAGWPLFRRTNRVLPLPVPERGGSLDELRDLLNVTDETWPLVLGWLIAAPFGWIARPWLFHTGPQGSAKTDGAVLILCIIDPRKVLTSAPRKGDRSDPAALASSSFLLGFDNLSHVPPELSDWLCSLVTGGEDSRRVLHTTSSTVSLEFMRTGIMTGISLSGLKPDLLERLIVVEFPRIDPYSRRLHGEVTKKFEAARPRLLGALLDAVSVTLGTLDQVDPNALGVPRMGDYAAILKAYDLGAGTNVFGAYKTVVGEAFDQAVDEDPVAAVVMSYMAGRDEPVEMEPTDLYSSLTVHRLSMNLPEDAYWPKTARDLTVALKRLAAILEGHVQISWRRSNGRRLTSLSPANVTGPSRTASPESSQAESSMDSSSDCSDSVSSTFQKENNIHKQPSDHDQHDGLHVSPLCKTQTPSLATPASPKPASDDPTCQVCRLRMVTVEPGQKTHPACDPGDTEGMTDNEVHDHALKLLAGELGAERIPPDTPKWCSDIAKKQAARRKKGRDAAASLGLAGYFLVENVGSVSAKVTWDLPGHRDQLTADQQAAVREVALRYAERHRQAHRSAANAPPAIGKNYVLAVISKIDVPPFLTDVAVAINGAP